MENMRSAIIALDSDIFARCCRYHLYKSRYPRSQEILITRLQEILIVKCLVTIYTALSLFSISYLRKITDM